MTAVAPPPIPPARPPSAWNDPSRGGGHSALSPARLLVVFGAIFLLVVIVAAVAVALLAPGPTPPDCPDPAQVCSGPPVIMPPVGRASPRPGGPSTSRLDESPAPSAPVLASPAPSTEESAEIIVLPRLPDPNSPPLRTGELFSSSQWLYGVQHEDYWEFEEQPDGAVSAGVAFNGVPATVNIRFDSARAGDLSPSEMIQRLEEGYRSRIQSLAESASDQDRILRPTIGLVAAEGRTYRGTFGNEGSIEPISLVIIAATDGRLTVGVTVVATIPDSTLPDGTRVFRAAGYLVDPLLKRFQWQVTP